MPKDGKDHEREPWWPRLRVGLEALHDELLAERTKALTGTLDVETIAAESQRINAMLSLLGGDRWQAASDEELASFKKERGHALADVRAAAFGRKGGGVLGPTREARVALVQLISWDHRYLFFPSVQLALARAQRADDRKFLQAVGKAIWQNDRYGGRGQRTQRLLTRMLIDFDFGNRDAYQDGSYLRRVREALIKVFHDAGVPDTHPSMDLLNDYERLRRHLRRIGRLPSDSDDRS